MHCEFDVFGCDEFECHLLREELSAEADEALYQAKAQGHNKGQVAAGGFAYRARYKASGTKTIEAMFPPTTIADTSPGSCLYFSAKM